MRGTGNFGLHAERNAVCIAGRAGRVYNEVVGMADSVWWCVPGREKDRQWRKASVSPWCASTVESHTKHTRGRRGGQSTATRHVRGYRGGTASAWSVGPVERHTRSEQAGLTDQSSAAWLARESAGANPNLDRVSGEPTRAGLCDVLDWAFGAGDSLRFKVT